MDLPVSHLFHSAPYIHVSAVVACVTARQAIRCKNVIDDFQTDPWNQLEES